MTVRGHLENFQYEVRAGEIDRGQQRHQGVMLRIYVPSASEKGQIDEGGGRHYLASGELDF